MKPTIVYHAVKNGIDCPDGICAAWVAVRALGLSLSQYVLVPFAHIDNEAYFAPRFKLPFELQGDIYILDLAFPEQILRNIASEANKLTVIDHHKSNVHVRDLVDTKSIYGIFDIAECGATAAWKYFHGNGIAGKISQPWFLPYVRQRDTGADGYYMGLTPESEAIGEAMSVRRRSYGIGINAFEFFDRLIDIPRQALIEKGMPLIEARNRAIDSFLDSQLQMQEVAGDSVPFFDLRDRPHLHRHYSMIGAKAALKYPQFPFVALTTDGENISLRSRLDGVDVSAIAESLGGGGHTQAAGYKIKVNQQE